MMYKSGENRAKYVEGGQTYTEMTGARPTSFWPENSYYESNNIPVTIAPSDLTSSLTPNNLPAVDEAIITKLNYLESATDNHTGINKNGLPRYQKYLGSFFDFAVKIKNHIFAP